MELTLKGGVRKAQVYSLIAILLSIPIMLFIAFYITETQNIKYGALEKILADQLHEVEKSIENDFEQAMAISGKRAFLAATDYVIKEGTPLDDATLRIEELMTNGSLYESPVMIMHNNTIQDWVDKVEALDLGIQLSIKYTNPSVSNQNGLRAKLLATLDINVSDYSGLGRISRSILKEAEIPLTGIEDPTFPLNTLGFVSRSINPYPYPYHAIKMASGSGLDNCQGDVTFDINDPDKANKILVVGDAAGISGFAGVVGEGSGIPTVSCYIVSTGSGTVNHVNQIVAWSGYNIVNIDNPSGGLWSLPVREAIEHGYYSHFPSGGGPDMLKRFEDDLSVTSMGMESIVNYEELQENNVQVKTTQVSIDFLYFSDQTINGQSVRGLQDWFRINAANAGRYNLTELM